MCSTCLSVLFLRLESGSKVYCRLDRDPLWHTVAVMQTHTACGYLWTILPHKYPGSLLLMLENNRCCHLYTSTHGSLLNQREMEPAKSWALQKPPFKHDQHQFNIIPVAWSQLTIPEAVHSERKMDTLWIMQPSQPGPQRPAEGCSNSICLYTRYTSCKKDMQYMYIHYIIRYIINYIVELSMIHRDVPKNSFKKIRF